MQKWVIWFSRWLIEYYVKVLFQKIRKLIYLILIYIHKGWVCINIPKYDFWDKWDHWFKFWASHHHHNIIVLSKVLECFSLEALTCTITINTIILSKVPCFFSNKINVNLSCKSYLSNNISIFLTHKRNLLRKDI